MVRCRRYSFDGLPCSNGTEFLDGWCREGGCHGFTRTRGNRQQIPTRKAWVKRIAMGDPAALTSFRATRPLDFTDLEVRSRAIKAFQRRHGGSSQDAEVQLRSMAEDFALRSSGVLHRVHSGNPLVCTLQRAGYWLLLHPRIGTLMDYHTLHLDRTWAQVRAGVPSRTGYRWNDSAAECPDSISESLRQLTGSSLADFLRQHFRPSTAQLLPVVLWSYGQLTGIADSVKCQSAARHDLAEATEFGSPRYRNDDWLVLAHGPLRWRISVRSLQVYGVLPRGHRTEATVAVHEPEVAGS